MPEDPGRALRERPRRGSGLRFPLTPLGTETSEAQTGHKLTPGHGPGLGSSEPLAASLPGGAHCTRLPLRCFCHRPCRRPQRSQVCVLGTWGPSVRGCRDPTWDPRPGASRLPRQRRLRVPGPIVRERPHPPLNTCARCVPLKQEAGCRAHSDPGRDDSAYDPQRGAPARPRGHEDAATEALRF